MLSEYAVAQYNWQYVCVNVVNRKRFMKAFKDLRIARQPLRSTQHGWPLQKGVPYWKVINNMFGLFENGIWKKVNS